MALRGGCAVAIMHAPNPEFAERIAHCGARSVERTTYDDDALRRAGVCEAVSLLSLTDDDHLNLNVALRARDLNPQIRLVMRQYNRTLGRKIEQNLPNCSVISLSSHSAATYAGTAVDPACFYGLQFPDIDGPLVGFARRNALDAEVAGATVAEAEERLDARILAVDGALAPPAQARIESTAEILVAARVRPAGVGAVGARATRRSNLRDAAWTLRRTFRQVDPVARIAVIVAVAIFVAATVAFAAFLKIDPLSAAYFVVETMTTTGYGDITPRAAGGIGEVAAMLLMLAGIAFSGIFIAILSSRFTQAQFIATQGLRRVHRRDHVIVCGAGNVGSRVIGFLQRLERQVVVIEVNPKPEVVEKARGREFDLLTGDASHDTTLDLCNLQEAAALIALTNSDTMNLEVALGARARSPSLPVVMRCQEAAFAESVSRHFGIDRAFGTAGLAAPVFAGLARTPGVRGRVELCGRAFGIAEQLHGESVQPPPAPDCTALFAWRGGTLVRLGSFGDVAPFDRVLYLYPMEPPRDAEARP